MSILLAAGSLTVSAQTEGNDKITLSGNDTAFKKMDFNNQILTDTMRFNVEALQPELLPATVDRQMSSMKLTDDYTMQGSKSLLLWRSGGLNVSGAQDEMLGMMNLETGVVVLYQDFGRLHFTATAKSHTTTEVIKNNIDSKNLENSINSDVLYTCQLDFLYCRVDFD